MVFSLLFGISLSRSQQAVDVQHYDISLDISNIASQSIRGCCTVQLKSQTNNLQQLSLDLLEMTVDSILIDDVTASFTYNDTLLRISLPQTLNQNDTEDIQICYHGQPVGDATWGGFYFTGNYAYNMGVGFTSNPHNLGKAWFPCADNFTDRATYDFHITTVSSHKAFCNGLLQGTTTNPNGTITWHWKMPQTIPTYLASVAVSAYTSLHDTFRSISGDSVPVILAAQPADTGKLRSSFVHLPDAFAAFEQSYGQHRFVRVGYVLVPFSGGAMEHATNICYSRALITGGLEYETTMAHELSHHWWGNLVTCETAEDMWLNEGWAVYSENIFMEKVYGRASYKKSVRQNHKSVLQFTHIQDDGYRAVSGVPHDYTYGRTVYDKGADVAHTLRGYLGDSLFFACIQSYLDAFKFRHANSADFREHLSRCSGIDLNSFFDNWVFAPGFPHFSVDSFFVTSNDGSYDVTVFIRQRLKAAPEFFSSVPLELTFISENFDSAGRTILFSGRCGIYHATLGFEPAFVAIDIDEKISDAITDKFYRMSNTGNFDFEEALLTMNVTQLPSQAFVRVEHNWIAPDPFKTNVPGLHISKERYWKVDGIIPGGFTANATISFDGTPSLSTGYLDNGLISNSEDSLVILYRPDVKTEWAVHPSFTVNPQGSTANKRGRITIHNVAKGEYALGIWDHSRPVADSQVVSSPCFVLGTKAMDGEEEELQFQIFPNPANDSFYIEFAHPLLSDVKISVLNLSGKAIREVSLKPGESRLYISMKGWSRTTYLVTVTDANHEWVVKKVMVLN
ncbi:MAG TPA: M1 family aminopeptidase [Chitinophagales bacterium]|nr:M1 family aminopeptidase [Chitinophagales bacterium]